METKKRPIFWISLGVWAMVLLFLGGIFFAYANNCLKEYEASQVENAIDGLVDEFHAMVKDGSVMEKSTLLRAAGELESPETVKELYVSQFDGVSSLTYQKDKKSYDATAPVYDVYAGDALVARLTLAGRNEHTIFGILKIVDWEIDEIQPVFHAETYAYRICVPVGYQVAVNGNTLSEAYATGESVDNPEFQYVSEYVEMPALTEYRIEGLVSEPVIDIYTADGSPVDFTPDASGNIFVAYAASSDQVPQDIADRSLEMAKTWQNFMNSDLPGANHGLETVQANLIRDSYYWKLADEYAHGPDITFISDHRADSPEYTNVAVDHYVSYTDNCYSVHISVTKNMILTKTGAKAQDTLNSTFYFVNYDDSEDGVDNPHWAIVDMIASTAGTP